MVRVQQGYEACHGEVRTVIVEAQQERREREVFKQQATASGGEAFVGVGCASH